MAIESNEVFDYGQMTANADLSAKQYYFVKVASATQVALCAAATDRALGVLRNKPKSGEAALVRVLGVAKVVSDGSVTAIAAGDYVGPNAAGKAVKKAIADYSVAGIALEASAADGAVISVLLIPGAFFRTAAG
jgi:hypothetical protein